MRPAKPLRAVALGVLFVVATAMLAAPPALAGVGDYDVSDPSKVYLGNSKLFQRPATVDCDRVFSHIPEYQDIVRRGLTDKNPAYHLLMKKASKRFAKAVKTMASKYKHDLVALRGSVQKVKANAKDIPDRTEEVIQALD